MQLPSNQSGEQRSCGSDREPIEWNSETEWNLKTLEGLFIRGILYLKIFFRKQTTANSPNNPQKLIPSQTLNQIHNPAVTTTRKLCGQSVEP
jgi:hypothetical protein